MSSFADFFKHTVNSVSDAQSQLLNLDQSLDDAVANAQKNGLPPISIGPSQGNFLSILCQFVGAKKILEIGTLGGYSTLFFAKSVPGVHVTSIEIDPKHRDVALENLNGQGNVDVILGAALDVLPTLQDKGPFDFVFIDADWERQKEYFDWAVKLSRQGACIYVDNAVRQITESEASDPTRLALIEHVRNDSRVHASLIPMVVTSKNDMKQALDGYLIAVKK